MSQHSRQSWFAVATLIGVGYGIIGIVLALPSSHARLWRLAAWGISGVVFAAHIAYEQFRLATLTRATAWHTALAAAIGAFGLAVAANIHELWVSPGYRLSLAVALVAWPALTIIPAFVVALVGAAALARFRGRQQRSHPVNPIVR